MAEDEANSARDSGTTDFEQIRDALIGETDADNYRHVIVRSAFLEEFWHDEKVQALVSRWARTTGLERCALRVANASEQIAELAGLESRGEVHARDEFSIEEDQVYAFEAASSELEAACEDLMLQIGNPKHADSITKDAMDFVIGLGLPYPWLVFELIEATLQSIIGFALGQVFRKEGWYEPEPLSNLAAPLTSMSFQTQEGESVEQALERLFEGVGHAMNELLASVPTAGKVPDRTIPALERNARWFYRHRVKGDSVRSIAMKEFGSSDRRKDVYDGIKRAEQLLDLTQYRF